MNRISSPRALVLRIGLVATLLILALIGLLVREDRARATGQEVRLAMEAVDPRSLLSGHYAALQLTEALPPGQDCPPDLETHYGGDESWVALSPSPEGHHRVTGAGASREAALRHGPVAVRGDAHCRQAFAAPPPVPEDGAPLEDDRVRDSFVTLDVGVDRFYADQDEAVALEESLRAAGQPGGPAAFAIVSIGQDGRARLRGVEVDGTRADLNWF